MALLPFGLAPNDRLLVAFVRWCRLCARRGQRGPSNQAVAIRFGFRSLASVSLMVRRGEALGLFRVERFSGRARIISAPDGAWATAQPHHAPPKHLRPPRIRKPAPPRLPLKPGTPRQVVRPPVAAPGGSASRPNPILTPAQQQNVDEVRRRRSGVWRQDPRTRRLREAQPLTPDQEAAAIAAFLRDHLVTRCPSRAAAAIHNNTGFGGGA